MKHPKLLIIIFCLFSCILSFGQNTFQRTYGFKGYNYGKCAYQTDDGGYIILGDISGYGGNTDIYLVKTDTLGKIEWDKAIGDTEIYWANDFKITHDKGYIIAGYTDKNAGNGYDVLLIKTDSSGNVKWEKTYGGTDWDLGYSVIEDKHHNYLIAGETFSYSFGGGDVYVIKTDSMGDTIWTKHYGGTGNDIAYSIDTTLSSNYIVSGVTQGLTDSTYDAYLLKINSNGDTIFTKAFSDSLDNKFFCARQIDSSGYVVCGSVKNLLGSHQLIIKTDTLGNRIWMRVFINPKSEELYDIKKSWDNDLVATGYTTSSGAGGEDITITLYTSDGWFITGNNFGGLNNDVSYSVNLTSDSGYICTGTTESFGLGISNIYFVKTKKPFPAFTSPPTQETGIVEINPSQGFSFSAFPNPTTGLLKVNINNAENEQIDLKVINILGIELISDSFKPAKSLCYKTINLSGFPDGVYIVQVSGNKYSTGFKVIKQTSR
jgi:hypothetical protein